MNTVKLEQKKVAADILLRRKNKIVMSAGKHSNTTQAQALAINIASLGYVFSPELMKVLETVSVEKLTALHDRLISQLQKMVGAHVKHKPLFKNFPDDVPAIIDFDKVVEHLNDTINFSRNFKFLGCGHLIYTDQADLTELVNCPICDNPLEEHELFGDKKPKDSEETGMKFRTLHLGKESDLFILFKNLLGSKTSISAQDKEDIAIIFETHKGDIVKHFPDEIAHKETLSFVANLVLTHLDSFEFLAGKIKTSTDVLRIAVAMSNGDVSLATRTKFKKFSKKERRFLLTLLEGSKNILEDMLRYKNEWIRIGEIIHPGSYATRFPASVKAFSMLRDGAKVETFNSKTENLIEKEDVLELSKHLVVRPSEFGRKLDYMLSNVGENNQANIVSLFGKVVSNIPTPVLLQIMSNFFIRNKEDKKIRIILPKGNLAKVKILDDERKPFSDKIVLSVVEQIENTLKERFAKMEPLGKVYVDNNLSTYLIPSSQRSASKALKTIVRGSQITMSDEKYVRMFLYWKEPTGNRTDIDLSAVFYDSDWDMKQQISFTNLQGYDCHHSGDITSAPNGASEFIDINKQAVMERGVRYVVMNVYSFSSQPFVQLPECFAGIMGRNKPKSGEAFDARTVKHKFDLTAESQIAIPLILDLYTNKMIWTDINSASRGRHNMVENNSKTMKRVGQALARMVEFKANLGHLLNLHASARGEVVQTPEEADIVFNEENIPFETERIMSEFLA